MERTNLRKTLSNALLIGATIIVTSAMADTPQGAYAPCGMGPEMMGGNGSGYGMGTGMMGGNGSGYGMGSGMMGGYGSRYGMGSEMLGNHAQRSDLNLTTEQRGKIGKIQENVRRKHWDLMGKMQDEEMMMNEQYNSDNRDDSAISNSYRKMSEFRRQMFDLSLSARSQIDAVLTKEQREKQRHG